MNKNTRTLCLYFYSVSEKRIKEWKKLIYKLSPNFEKIICITTNDDFKKEIEGSVYKVLSEKKFFGFLKSSPAIDLEIYFNGHYKLENFSKHPEFKRNLRIIPLFLRQFIIRRLIRSKVNFFENIILEYQVTNLMIMEPKNFLYSSSVISIESICKKNNVDFKFIHVAFLHNNLKMFDNLNRYDSELFKNLKGFNLDFKEENFINDFKKDYQDFLFRDFLMMYYGINEVADTSHVVTNQPYILWLANKPSNYRAHYVKPDFSDNEALALARKIPKGYKLVFKHHPKGYDKRLIKLLEDEGVVVYKGFDNYNLINKAEFVICTASHSFVDALLLNKKVVLFGDYNFLFSYNNGPFIKLKDINQLLSNFEEIIKSDIDISEINKLFFMIISLIKDKALSLENLKATFERKQELFETSQSVETIVKYYKNNTEGF